MNPPIEPAVLAGRLVEVADDGTGAGLSVARVLAAAGARVLIDAGPAAATAVARLRGEGLPVYRKAELPDERPDVVVSPDRAVGRLDQVVVVGMGIAVPGASSPEQFWQLLRTSGPMFAEPGGRLDLSHLWSPEPADEDRTYTRTAGFMHDFTPHPKLAAEIADGSFAAREYTAIWLRHALLQATDRVRMRPLDRQLFAVGLTPDGSQHLEQSLITRGVRDLLGTAGVEPPAGLADRYPLAEADPDQFLPYRIARMAIAGLAAEPEIVVVDTACSSSLYSIDIGVRALLAGDAELALCGGAFALTAQNLVLFSKLRGLSRSGRVRSMDAAADGVLFSDGAALLALKTHARAVADGDPILGFVAGFGGSSDGRGKAIYAPNPAGQRIALQRAWAAAGVQPAELDWVVAHATGTPTGDRTEMVALADSAPPGTCWTMTSNKSLVGHSGWAAGAVSAIHALLALRHEAIPAQREFDQLPAGAPESVRVPREELRWPADPQRPRRVGISAMGFGGTNGHLVLSDRAATRSSSRPGAAASDEIVLVGAGWHLPGDPSREQLAGWLAGDEPRWPASFGADYPLPSPTEVRLAPTAIAAMDRSQLMALRCLDQLGTDWVTDPAVTARTGVLVGHTGPTRAALGYDLRCVLAELSSTVLAPAGIPAELVTEPVRAMVRPTNEDSYPGLMPNIIAARLAQRLDLHGLNMTLDAGRDSVQSALANAVRYLRDGELELAVVLGVNATSEFVRGWQGRQPAEAAVGFLVTRRSVAERLGLAVLGRLAIATSDQPASRELPPLPGNRDHRGAEGALALLRVLLTGSSETVRIGPVEGDGTPTLLVTAEPTARTVEPIARIAEPTACIVEPTARTVEPTARIVEPAAAGTGPTNQPNQPTVQPNRPTATPSEPTELAADFSRYRVQLRPRPADHSVAQPVAALPPGSLVILDRPEALAGVPLPPGCLIVAPPPASAAERIPQLCYPADAAALHQLLAADGRRFDHLRVVLSRPAADSALAVHELTFAAAQACAEQLAGGGSLAMLLLGAMSSAAVPTTAMSSAVPDPLAGLFGGLARSLRRELPGGLILAVVTDTTDPGCGQRQLATELASSRLLPVAYYLGDQRHEALIEPITPEPVADSRLPKDPVLVATGGASGLTAHLVQVLAAGSRPHSIWLLGSSPAPASSAEPLAAKPELIRRLMTQYPGEKLAEVTRRYERLVRDGERQRTIALLRELAGPGGVHYLQCDVLDQSAVRAAVAAVLAHAGRIDVVVHGAGLTRSASLTRKQPADFRAVRDVKVRGYLHLREAIGAAGQQPALWCSVSSVSALVGMRGEFDYCSGNEYLMLAAAWARSVEGRDEVALTSGLWLESGMASADTPGGAFLARQAEIGQLSDVQGRQFFAAELAGRPRPGQPAGPLVTTWLGELDFSSLQAIAPGLAMAAGRPAPAAAAVPAPAGTLGSERAYRGSAFLVEPVSRARDGARWSCRIELDRHAYLLDHLVDGRPALPGTFILELGVEAALALAPELVPVAITDVVFERFIRAAEHRWPRTVLVEARRAGTAVTVRVLSPATALLPELEHSRMVVRLATGFPPPTLVAAPAGDGRPAPNTYRMPGTPVRLSGIFDALVEPRFEPDGGSASCRLAVPSQPFREFRLPSLLLDCLLRTVVLDGADPTSVAVLVPTGLARVQLFDGANDLELASRYPAGIVLRHWREPRSGASRCTASTPDGRLLVQVDGITGAEQGRFEVAGGWRTGSSGAGIATTSGPALAVPCIEHEVASLGKIRR